MNYFQRLIKRAKAQTANSQGVLYDPFTKTENNPVHWPQTQSQSVEKRLDEKKSTNIISPTQPVEQKHKVEGVIAQQQAAENLKDSKQTEKIIEAPKDITNKISTPEKPLKQEDDTHKILNQTPGIAIIDQLMEPYINSFKSSTEKQAVKPESVSDTSEEMTTGTETKNLTQTIKPVSIATTTIDKGTAPVAQTLTPENPPPKKMQAINQQSINERVERKILEVEEKLTKSSQSPKSVQRQNRVVVVNQTTSRNGAKKSESGGSPHIGIGQL